MNIVIKLRFDPNNHADLIKTLMGDDPWSAYRQLELPPGFHVDQGYFPVDLSLSEEVRASDSNGAGTSAIHLLIRGEIVGDAPRVFGELKEDMGYVASVELDHAIVPCAVDWVDPIRRWGSALDIRTKFQKLAGTGDGVYLCLVDTGINERYLTNRFPGGNWATRLTQKRDGMGSGEELAKRIVGKINSQRQAHGRQPFTEPLNSCPSWHTWQADPSYFENGHGTMMAFDAALLAPDAIPVDLPILQSETFETLVSDVAKTYAELSIQILRSRKKPKVVVNNSWQLKNPAEHGSWKYNQPGEVLNSFIELITSLCNVDFVFAAGNCGWPGECTSLGYDTIYGANSHPDVLTVGACNVADQWISISSAGYGWLTKEKPDICFYSHFEGSGIKIYHGQSPDLICDGGTSAAAAVASGLVAALRQVSLDSPADLRQKVRAMSRLPGNPNPAPYDRTMGWGIPRV